jgi:hypothetical protein
MRLVSRHSRMSAACPRIRPPPAVASPWMGSARPWMGLAGRSTPIVMSCSKPVVECCYKCTIESKHLHAVQLSIRAGTLLHVSSLISCPVQCHIEFLVMLRKESQMREKCGCLAKQLSYRLKFRSMRLLSTLYELLLPWNLKYFFISSTNQGV